MRTFRDVSRVRCFRRCLTSRSGSKVRYITCMGNLKRATPFPDSAAPACSICGALTTCTPLHDGGIPVTCQMPIGDCSTVDLCSPQRVFFPPTGTPQTSPRSRTSLIERRVRGEWRKVCPSRQWLQRARAGATRGARVRGPRHFSFVQKKRRAWKTTGRGRRR